MRHRLSLCLSLITLGASLVFPMATNVARSENHAEHIGSATIGASATVLRAAHLRTGTRGLPLAFEINRGQLDAAIQYRARGEGFALLLERDAGTQWLTLVIGARTDGT